MTEFTVFLTVVEVAHQLQVHPETVRRLVRRGEINCTAIGRRIRISLDALKEWSERRQETNR